MAYAITEYEFWSNPKVREAGKDAVLLYLAGNSYCNQFMTDGLIIKAAASTIAHLAFQNNPKRAIKALIDSRLWIEVDGGYQVHDYLKHNKSRAQIEDLINKKSAAGKASALARGSTPEPTDVQTPAEQVFNIEQALNPTSISLSIKQPQEEAGRVFSAYESEIGMLTGMVRDSVVDALEEYPPDWIITAMHEAATNNKRNWKYCEAILKRWKADGFQTDSRIKNGKKKREPDLGGYEVDRTSEVIFIDDGGVIDDGLHY